MMILEYLQSHNMLCTTFCKKFCFIVDEATLFILSTMKKNSRLFVCLCVGVDSFFLLIIYTYIYIYQFYRRSSI